MKKTLALLIACIFSCLVSFAQTTLTGYESTFVDWRYFNGGNVVIWGYAVGTADRYYLYDDNGTVKASKTAPTLDANGTKFVWKFMEKDHDAVAFAARNVATGRYMSLTNPVTTDENEQLIYIDKGDVVGANGIRSAATTPCQYLYIPSASKVATGSANAYGGNYRVYMHNATLGAVGYEGNIVDKTGYDLVYSSETPEACAASMEGLKSLSEEELSHCTGDFMNRENLERNWYYSPKQTSTWNKRMATNDEDRELVHQFDNGTLRMLAISKDGTADGFITSGVEMKNGYQYGIYEIKAKVNPHASNFPAVWMMPSIPQYQWPDCGEIDIMEQIGTSSTVYSTVHLGARYEHHVDKGYAWSGSKWFDTNYHVYTLEWNENSLIFYTDGIQVFKYDKDKTLDLENNPDWEYWQFPYNKAYYIILDQALGMNNLWGPEEPDPSYTYEMDVEYVRIFQTPDQQAAHVPSVSIAPASSGIFTLSGQRVIHPHHGVYIVNGKKVIR